ncbi:MAG: M55 family metallopeptidase [Candidatus Bipolaricaulis sp.]|nr:M55 family metallopeptidase [Candidatus Bipolaricaulis sp.]
MRTTKKALYILCDVEGASGISRANWNALRHGSDLWRSEGRALITSDVKAVCEAANEFGIDEIIIDDEHDGGKREPNLLLEQLPGNVRVLRRPHLPGKARKSFRGQPFGMIFVGQHAMCGGGGFAAHTIAPHIGAIAVNGLRVGEIGLELASFMGSPLLALVGEEAAVAEARTLCPHLVGIPVKSQEKSWFPAAEETHAMIRRGTIRALRERETATGLHLTPPFRFTLSPADGYVFDGKSKMPMRWLVWLVFFRLSKGRLTEHEASWEAKTILRGVWALHCARGFLRKTDA